MISARLRLGDLESAVGEVLDRLAARSATAALWARDPGLFGSPPSECADRMGWLDAAEWAAESWADVQADAESLRGSLDQVVVMGMGGSSLFPDVLAATFGGPTALHLLDTTHPHHLARVLEQVPRQHAVHVVSSKSGSTVETRSQLALWRERGLAPANLAMVTDAGSELDALAASVGAAWTVHADPEVGGRFSALTAFGLVPAALLGVDGAALAEAALDQLDGFDPDAFGDDHEASWLAALIAASATNGRVQLTLVLDERVRSFGDWLEQLIAESLGKAGSGVIPVFGESIEHVVATGASRTVVTIGDVDGIDALRSCGVPMIELSLEDPLDLGAHVVLWEVATALAGAALGCNPFDQPDVESAKRAARSLLDASNVGANPAPLTHLDDALAMVGPGDCVAVCAFIDPGGPSRRSVEAARLTLGERCGVATTMGIGPRFLHSSGQLHKGGPRSQVIIQVVEPVERDLAVPDAGFTFGELFAAQAAGDLAALHAAGQRAIRVSLEEFEGLAG